MYSEEDRYVDFWEFPRGCDTEPSLAHRLKWFQYLGFAAKFYTALEVFSLLIRLANELKALEREYNK